MAGSAVGTEMVDGLAVPLVWIVRCQRAFLSVARVSLPRCLPIHGQVCHVTLAELDSEYEDEA